MATEAQKLIGISLTKIAQSRMNRGGISLHKNLLVATVLQKARFIFMEEAYGVSFAAVPTVEASGGGAEAEETRRGGKRRRERAEPAQVGEAAAKKNCAEERLCPVGELTCYRTRSDAQERPSEPMEVDRITSLVSVFGFGAHPEADAPSPPRLSRSVSTPDFCSAQAKELDGVRRQPALAVTV